MFPMSGRIWVEAWDPDYGASYDVANGMVPSEEEVAPGVEVARDQWAPLTPRASPAPALEFLDGVSRVDARAFLEAGPMTVPGICGSIAVGLVTVDGRAHHSVHQVHRSVIFGSGAQAVLPPIDQSLIYESRSVPGSTADELRHGLEALRAEVEVRMAQERARENAVVVADGPLGILEPLDIIGFIKSHQRAYLDPDLEPVVRALRAGQRTPLFSFGVIRPRYSWYLRLADAPGAHPWSGIARCEVSASMSIAKAADLADLASFHLPRFASKPFWDPRAPQNLVPIAALERHLRRLLGDPQMVLRKIRSALSRQTAREEVAES